MAESRKRKGSDKSNASKKLKSATIRKSTTAKDRFK